MAILYQAEHSLRASSLEINASSPPDDPRWQLVQRVAASQFFAKGPKLRAFFLYICENSLLGKPQNLTTQLIGVRVFGRNPDYLPSEDNIVRVEARELRKRLSAYFAGEGRREPIVIDIPKGGYLPVFIARELIETEPAPPPVVAAVPEIPSVRAISHRERPWLTPVLVSALVLATSIIVSQAVSSRSQRNHDAFLAGLQQTASIPADFSIYDDLLGSMGTNSHRDALLVLSNPRLITYAVAQSATDSPENADTSVTVPDAARSSFAPLMKERDRQFPFQFFHVSHNTYTGIGEAVAAFHIGRLMDVLGRRVHLTQGRFLNWDHIGKQDLILLGGPYSNDWTYQKDANANFSLTADSIANTKPLPGEPAFYKPDPSTDYALIQKLTTPYDFEILSVAGISSAGTAAAGEFLSNPARMNLVYRSMRAATSGRDFPRSWEVLLRVSVRDGLPINLSVAATRPGATQPRQYR